jgi:5-oxoprolinase (ATP-hydrolysing) subunit A
MSAMRVIDLNADLGEGGTDDAALLALVSSANIACGGHAGDDETMRRTINLARASGVAIGAHPGYEDRENFGRVALVLPLKEITALVRRQVEKLASFASDAGGRIHHVKPHGALYNQASRDLLLAAAVVKGVTAISPDLILYALPNSALADAGRAAGLTVWHEGFADRRYRDDGSLMPRGEPGAVIKDVETAVAQALEIASGGTVETLCIHGDGSTAVAMLRAIRAELGEAGFAVGR